jgi:hypothetical protein
MVCHRLRGAVVFNIILLDSFENILTISTHQRSGTIILSIPLQSRWLDEWDRLKGDHPSDLGFKRCLEAYAI